MTKTSIVAPKNKKKMRHDMRTAANSKATIALARFQKNTYDTNLVEKYKEIS